MRLSCLKLDVQVIDWASSFGQGLNRKVIQHRFISPQGEHRPRPMSEMFDNEIELGKYITRLSNTSVLQS